MTTDTRTVKCWKCGAPLQVPTRPPSPYHLPPFHLCLCSTCYAEIRRQNERKLAAIRKEAGDARK